MRRFIAVDLGGNTNIYDCLKMVMIGCDWWWSWGYGHGQMHARTYRWTKKTQQFTIIDCWKWIVEDNITEMKWEDLLE